MAAVATAAVMAAGVMVVTVDMEVVIMASDMVAAATVTAISVGIVEAASSPYPVRFHEAVFAAAALLPAAADRISARSETPRYDPETSATR
jgi:hypothetical protein